MRYRYREPFSSYSQYTRGWGGGGIIYPPAPRGLTNQQIKMDPRIQRWERRGGEPNTSAQYMRQKSQALANTPRPTLWRRLSDAMAGSVECSRGMWNGADVTCQNRPPAPAQTQTQSRRSERGRSPGLVQSTVQQT